MLKNPAIKARLISELRSTTLSYPAPHSTLKSLPYLSACIQEALRIHPVIGHIIERVVPSSGLTLPLDSTASSADSITLPPGTIIGMNPWIVHRNADVYGEKPDEFLPGRWLQRAGEQKDAYEVRTRKMRDADMSFGNGNRTCLGQPLAMVEVYKVAATLFGKYEVCSPWPATGG
jgi:cytochrome P450